MKLKQALGIVAELAGQNVLEPGDSEQEAKTADMQSEAVKTVESFIEKLKSSTSMTNAAHIVELVETNEVIAQGGGLVVPPPPPAPPPLKFEDLQLGFALPDGKFMEIPGHDCTSVEDMFAYTKIVSGTKVYSTKTGTFVEDPNKPKIDPDSLDKKPSSGPLSDMEKKVIEMMKIESQYEDKTLNDTQWAQEYLKLRAFFRANAYSAQKYARLKTKAMPDGKVKVLTYIQLITAAYEKAAKQVQEVKELPSPDEAIKDLGIDLEAFKGNDSGPSVEAKSPIKKNDDGSFSID